MGTSNDNNKKGVMTTVTWETMRKKCSKNYIRGPNVKYRVCFREKNVQYLNSVGLCAHTIEAVDKKGR